MCTATSRACYAPAWVEFVRAGADVVVDFSFWSRAMREGYRELLRPLGVVPETVYLATDRATALQRVAARTAGRATTSRSALSSRPSTSITSSLPRRRRVR
jgi:predicted kinase